MPDPTQTPTLQPIAYLYHDARVPTDAHPWLHSTLLVLAADRRPGARGETPLVTLEQAQAMVAAERAARQDAQHRLEQMQEDAIRHQRDMGAAVMRERERCANAVRYWLTGHAPAAGTCEAQCLAHILEGKPDSGWTERA